MEIIKILALTNYFVQYILLVILVGVLVGEYFRRKDKFKKGLFLYLILTVSITIFVVLDNYRVFVGIERGIIMNILMLMNTGQLLLFIVNSIRVWSFINKKLFFGIPIFVIGIILFESGLNLFFGDYFDFLNIISVFGATILYYFFIVSFLIDTSPKKIDNKGNG